MDRARAERTGYEPHPMNYKKQRRDRPTKHDVFLMKEELKDLLEKSNLNTWLEVTDPLHPVMQFRKGLWGYWPKLAAKIEEEEFDAMKRLQEMARKERQQKMRKIREAEAFVEKVVEETYDSTWGHRREEAKQSSEKCRNEKAKQSNKKGHEECHEEASCLS